MTEIHQLPHRSIGVTYGCQRETWGILSLGRSATTLLFRKEYNSDYINEKVYSKQDYEIAST